MLRQLKQQLVAGILGSKYLGSIATVISGASVAQFIPLAISPVLTRLYTPDDFGQFAVYTAATATIAGIASGRYEVAILLPRSDYQAVQITYLGCLLALCTSIVTAVGVWAFSSGSVIDFRDSDPLSWIYLLPVAVLVSGLYQCFSALNIRLRSYRFMAINKVVGTSSTAFGQVSIGFIKPSGGLIVGQFLGQLIALTSMIMRIYKKNINHPISAKVMRESARTYAKFPKIDVPTVFLNLSASQAPLLLLPLIFSPAVAGSFFLTQRVLQAPITLISNSVLEVFKREAAVAYQERGECSLLYIKTAKILCSIAVLPSLLCFMFIENVFEIVFGEAWAEAGSYAKTLTPALFLRFIANPLSFMLYIAGKQGWNLMGMGFLLIAVLLSLGSGNTPEDVVFMISISYSVFYLGHLWVSAKLAKTF